MKVLSLFSGIGAFEKALKNKGINFELTGFSEIDKYAVKSYCAIHNVDESKNFGDITKIDETALPKNIDLITYGFPCQDISIAGKQKGLLNDDGTQTRSGLFFEALRIIEATKPRVAIAENVKNLTSKKFAEQFKIVLESLEEAGYNNYYKVLNAKDYGIPQNRERVFIVSIRKDVDNGAFTFPEGFPLELRLKDMLEDVVDEKFYLSDKAIAGFYRHAERHADKGNGFGWNPTDGNVVANALLTSAGSRPCDNFIKEPTVKQIANLMPGKNRANPNQGRLYDSEGLSPTLGAMQGGNRQPFVIADGETIKVREAVKSGYAEAVEGDSINLEQPNSKTRRGRVGKQVAQTLTTSPQQGVVVDNENTVDDEHFLVGGMQKNQAVKTDGISTCLTSSMGTGGGYVPMHNYTKDLRIRKLTPKEYWRLMGFEDSGFEKAEAVNSNTQLYKQAGNSIVVNVLEKLFESLFEVNAFENEVQ